MLRGKLDAVYNTLMGSASRRYFFLRPQIHINIDLLYPGFAKQNILIEQFL